MTTTTTKTKINVQVFRNVVVDSDALFALFNKNDANAPLAESLFKVLANQKARLIFPSTMLVACILGTNATLRDY